MILHFLFNKLQVASDSAYESIAQAATASPAPTSQRDRTSFLAKRNEEEDLDFLDDLDL